MSARHNISAPHGNNPSSSNNASVHYGVTSPSDDVSDVVNADASSCHLPAPSTPTASCATPQPADVTPGLGRGNTLGSGKNRKSKAAFKRRSTLTFDHQPFEESLRQIQTGPNLPRLTNTRMQYTLVDGRVLMVRVLELTAPDGQAIMRPSHQPIRDSATGRMMFRSNWPGIFENGDWIPLPDVSIHRPEIPFSFGYADVVDPFNGELIAYPPPMVILGPPSLPADNLMPRAVVDPHSREFVPAGPNPYMSPMMVPVPLPQGVASFPQGMGHSAPPVMPYTGNTNVGTTDPLPMAPIAGPSEFNSHATRPEGGASITAGLDRLSLAGAGRGATPINVTDPRPYGLDQFIVQGSRGKGKKNAIPQEEGNEEGNDNGTMIIGAVMSNVAGR